jgi:hypothetical protein
MIRRLLFLCVLVVPGLLSAKEVFLPISGSAGVFRSDVRIFNPSQTKSIQIQAYYLPVGNINNAAVQPTAITIPRRQMAVYNDVVSSLFHSSGLGGIRLTSPDDFVVTERVYATSTSACSGPVNPCTLGQFVNGVDSASALASGVLIQLNSPGGAAPASRTNIGAQNPNNATANVVWRVYDRSNVLVGTPKTIVMPPYAIISPSDIRSFGTTIPAGADLSDAWVSFTSDRPIVAYASVVDNGSTDQTFIPATEDTDPTANTTPPPPATNFTGTFSGRACPGSQQCEVGSVANSNMSMTITQTGNSISGFGSIYYESLHPEARVSIEGTVSGTALSLKLTDLGGGCFNLQFTHTVTTATTDFIAGTYVKRGGCNQTTITGSFAVARRAPTGPTALTNGQTVSNISVASGGWTHFVLRNVPAGKERLAIVSAGGTGDVDMYVKRGSQPTVGSYDYRSNGGTNSESVTVTKGIFDLDDVIAGDWYISLYGYATSGGVSLTAGYQ